MRWNERLNLTAVRDPGQIVTRHFGESFFLARHLFPQAGPGPSSGTGRVLDVGSGAGFPGLPIKIWAPAVSVSLVESNHKKVAFLREVVRALTLTDVNVICARAETLLPDAPAASGEPSSSTPAFVPAGVVTLRAVERFETILPVAARLVRPGGRLALMVGAAQAVGLPALPPGVHWTPPIPIPGSQARVLSIGIRQ